MTIPWWLVIGIIVFFSGFAILSWMEYMGWIKTWGP
jgi:hypothetical protein